MRIVHAGELPASFFEYREAAPVEGVREIMDQVRRRGDAAVVEYTARFDGVELSGLRVPLEDIHAARDNLSLQTAHAIRMAGENIRRFAEMQMRQFGEFEVELQPGVFTGQKVVPLDRVGVYVPGGRFPLISTLLMTAIPAQVAGVKEIAICSPPTHQGSVHPAILAAAEMLGLNEVYRVGGVQAIAALACGTQSIPRVDKIVGPGNAHVARAKREVFGEVGIDLVAGPTEVMIIADESANPRWVAADLLAQAEHDPEAQPVLVTPSEALAEAVPAEIQAQLATLPTAEIAREAVERNGWIIRVDSLEAAAEIANRKAPEHLQLQVAQPEVVVPLLRHYGSLFIGELSAEVLGDYSAGINHTLPTNGVARYRGGLSVQDFIKLQTTLRVTERGIRDIGPVAGALAKAEGLEGHYRSVALRMEKNP